MPEYIPLEKRKRLGSFTDMASSRSSHYHPSQLSEQQSSHFLSKKKAIICIIVTVTVVLAIGFITLRSLVSEKCPSSDCCSSKCNQARSTTESYSNSPNVTPIITAKDSTTQTPSSSSVITSHSTNTTVIMIATNSSTMTSTSTTTKIPLINTVTTFSTSASATTFTTTTNTTNPTVAVLTTTNTISTTAATTIRIIPSTTKTTYLSTAPTIITSTTTVSSTSNRATTTINSTSLSTTDTNPTLTSNTTIPTDTSMTSSIVTTTATPTNTTTRVLPIVLKCYSNLSNFSQVENLFEIEHDATLTTFTQFTSMFTVPNGARTALLLFTFRSADETWWIDDVSIQENSDAGKELLTNGHFEAVGNNFIWEYCMPPLNLPPRIVTKSNCNSGQNCLASRSYRNEPDYLAQKLGVESNQAYNLTFYVRSAHENNRLAVAMSYD